MPQPWAAPATRTHTPISNKTGVVPLLKLSIASSLCEKSSRLLIMPAIVTAILYAAHALCPVIRKFTRFRKSRARFPYD